MRRWFTVAVALIASATVAAPAQAAATVAVSPSTNLYDGQVVVVRADGFTGDDKIILHECVRKADRSLVCDYRQRADSDRYGRVAGAAFHVYKFVQGQPCDATTRCFVRVKDTHGTAARASVSFRT